MRALLLFLTMTTMALAQDIYEIKDKTIDGKEFSMDSLKGKAILIVNIASQCGYTPQLADLEATYQKYKSKGLVVLGVPTNDFGGQTPEDDVGMKDFCTKNYNASFPILRKATIKGAEKRPLYRYLEEHTPQDAKHEVAWNFEKYLVDKSGKVVGWFQSAYKLTDKEVTQKIESVLK